VYDRRVADVSAFVDEVANELATWPGVRFERQGDGGAIVMYEGDQLGILYPERGVAEFVVPDREHDILIEHGEAEPAELTPDSSGVSHSIRGPSDITEVLELFDRRYRDLRGEDDPYTSEDPDYPQGRLDQLDS
jgi:Luciferase